MYFMTIIKKLGEFKNYLPSKLPTLRILILHWSGLGADEHELGRFLIKGQIYLLAINF